MKTSRKTIYHAEVGDPVYFLMDGHVGLIDGGHVCKIEDGFAHVRFGGTPPTGSLPGMLSAAKTPRAASANDRPVFCGTGGQQ